MSESTEDAKKEDDIVYPAIIIRGLVFPEPLLTKETIENLLDYKPEDGEIYITTYPKCGTTWTQFLVWEILNKGAFPPSPNQIMFKHMPFLEYAGADVIKDLPEPRVMKTHLPFHLQPYSPRAKYIYVVRNPWDCCVSYYHHHLLEKEFFKFTFNQYFNMFLTDKLGWGNFFDHALSWYEHRNDANVLFLTYEEMKKDTRKVLLQIAKFLGEQYYEDLQNEEVVQNCLKHSDFKFLKSRGMFFPVKETTSNADENDILRQMGEIDRNNKSDMFHEVNFFRKGIIGDWRSHFSQEQVKTFNEYLFNKLKNTPMENFWEPVEEETAL